MKLKKKSIAFILVLVMLFSSLVITPGALAYNEGNDINSEYMYLEATDSDVIHAEVTGVIEGMLGHSLSDQTIQIALNGDVFTGDVVDGYDVTSWFVIADFLAAPRTPAAMAAPGFPGIRNFVATVTGVATDRTVATVSIAGTPVIVNPNINSVTIPANRLELSENSLVADIDTGLLDIDVERNRGYTVTINPDSPTGVYVTFVYHNPGATRVQFRSEGRLLDTRNPPAIGGGAPTLANNPFPEQFQEGMVPGAQFGGLMAWRAFERDMQDLGDGYFAITVPMTGGATAYWYAVWGTVPGFPGTQSGRQIFDPYQPWTCPDFTTWSWRHHRGHTQSAAYVPWLPVQGAENYRPLELPHSDPAQRGTVVTHRYPSPTWTHAYLGGAANPQDHHFVLVYLPVGYETMTEPLPTIYVAHGNTNDAMDYMFTSGVKNIMDNLIASGDLPPTVLVSINYQHIAGAVARRNLITNYIIPSIEENFNVSIRPEHRAVGGFSIGGQIAAQLYQFNAADFGYFAPLSTFSPPSMAALRDAPNNLFPTLFVGCGLWEQASTYRMLPVNLRNAGIDFTHHEVHSGHDLHVIGRSMAYFLENVVTWESLAPTITTPQAVFAVNAPADVEIGLHLGAGRLEANGIASVILGTTVLAATDWSLDGSTLLVNEDAFDDHASYDYVIVQIVFDTVAPIATTRTAIVNIVEAETLTLQNHNTLRRMLEDGNVILHVPRYHNLGITGTLVVPEDRTLILHSPLNVGSNATLIIEGTVVVAGPNGRINSQGRGSTVQIAEGGTLINNVWVENVTGSIFENEGTIINNGRFEIRGGVTFYNGGDVVGQNDLRIHRDAIVIG
ncbi:MAG: alpha/beta hydrolase-fold protein [Oscillospiraceae bacterium]|nr:alpha/beta hydrolase-fold protein [Oscillospiraceae bacterium]